MVDGNKREYQERGHGLLHPIEDTELSLPATDFTEFNNSKEVRPPKKTSCSAILSVVHTASLMHIEV